MKTDYSIKWSRYNHLFETTQKDCLLYNSTTNSFAELDRDLFNLLKSVEGGSGSIFQIPEDLLETLKKAKVIVTNNDEKSVFYKKRFRYLLNSYNRNGLSLTIAPTVNCNFACPYCYEQPNQLFMNDEVIDGLISFVKSYTDNPQLNICWFGGEPLIALDVIKKILARLKEEKITLHNHSMITNGYLLEQDTFDFLLRNNINDIQITIDGNQETHNSRRIHKTNDDSYSVILKNIDNIIEVSSNVLLNIRVNIDETNKHEYINVYHELRNRWPNATNIHIYPGFITNFSVGCVRNPCEIDREKRGDFYIDLYKKHGINVGFYPAHRMHPCVADNINSFVVGPKGELYKCWCDTGSEDREVGSIMNDEVKNPDLYAEYMAGESMFDDFECRKCKLFPICNGGCRWFRMERKEDKSYYSCTARKNRLSEMLELHYEQRKKTSS